MIKLEINDSKTQKPFPIEVCVPYTATHPETSERVVFFKTGGDNFLFFNDSSRAGVTWMGRDSEDWLFRNYEDIRPLREGEGFNYKFTG